MVVASTEHLLAMWLETRRRDHLPEMLQRTFSGNAASDKRTFTGNVASLQEEEEAVVKQEAFEDNFL